MDNKCIFSRKEDGICEYKNEVRTSQSEVQKTSIKLMQSPRETTAQVLEKRETDEKEEKELYLDNIIKKASANPQQRKNQKKYHRALQIVIVQMKKRTNRIIMVLKHQQL